MPEYNPDILARLAAREAELGPRGSQPLPKGLYHMRASAEDSEVIIDGPPTLRLAFRVIAPETVTQGDTEVKVINRVLSNRMWWFAKEDDTKEKSLEERQAFTRKISGEFITDLMYQVIGAGYEDDGVSLDEALDGMQTDDEEVVTELMEAVVGILDGHDFFINISVRETDDAVFNNMRPFSYTRGKKGEEAVPFRLESYERGAQKLGVVDAEALANV